MPTHSSLHVGARPTFLHILVGFATASIWNPLLESFSGPTGAHAGGWKCQRINHPQNNPQPMGSWGMWVNGPDTSSFSWENSEVHVPESPPIPRGTPLHLPLFVISLLMHHLLASFPSLSPLSTLQPMLLGITSQTNYLNVWILILGYPSGGTPSLIAFHT